MCSSIREMKEFQLNTKSGIQKLIYTRKYRKLAEGLYQQVEVGFACGLSFIYVLLFPPQYARYRNDLPRWSHFVLTVYANLTLPMDQKAPGLYTYAGLAARMHSHRLLRRTNGRWMRGIRKVYLVPVS